MASQPGALWNGGTARSGDGDSKCEAWRPVSETFSCSFLQTFKCAPMVPPPPTASAVQGLGTDTPCVLPTRVSAEPDTD